LFVGSFVGGSLLWDVKSPRAHFDVVGDFTSQVKFAKNHDLKSSAFEITG